MPNDPVEWVTMEHAATGGTARVALDAFNQVHQYAGWTLAPNQIIDAQGGVVQPTEVQDLTPADEQPAEAVDTSTYAQGAFDTPSADDDPEENV
jgi:hypothetical protein